MTEIERLLQQALTALQNELTASVHTHDQELHQLRQEVKNLIRRMRQNNPFVEANIFRSVENVNLATVIAYKKDGVIHRFTDDY